MQAELTKNEAKQAAFQEKLQHERSKLEGVDAALKAVEEECAAADAAASAAAAAADAAAEAMKAWERKATKVRERLFSQNGMRE